MMSVDVGGAHRFEFFDGAGIAGKKHAQRTSRRRIGTA